MTQVLLHWGWYLIFEFRPALASSRRVEEVLQEEPAQINHHGIGNKGQHCTDNVSFTYKFSCSSPENISFQAHAETIGIIGPTGSGKSTLVNLVPFMMQPLAEFL